MSKVTSPDPLVGRVLADKYRLDAPAGTGATGTVYRATHLTLGKPLAIKVLADHLVDNPTAQARFRREARAASKLDHPNSVLVQDFGIEADGTTYLAMEFLEGRELYRAIYEDWPLGPERCAKIMGQVLSVLQAAHDLGIVHRDLKPENVMLVTRTNEDGVPTEVVKVADFGIAKSVAGTASDDSLNLTRDGTVHGTPEYMSPEQARGEELDGRADLYACGVMLYEMMTGSLPFSADSAFEVILKHLSDPVEPPTTRRPDCDPRLEPVVLKSLAKKRNDRFPDARSMRLALMDALRSGVTEEPVVLLRANSSAGVQKPIPLAPKHSPDRTAAVPLLSARRVGSHIPTEVMAAAPKADDSDEVFTLPVKRTSTWMIVLAVSLLVGAVLGGAFVAGGFSARGRVPSVQPQSPR
ncbi:MAG: protein kinase [Deltaproteobacteria bacterium]|nr:protein kinase [Deltaproteobacteria bacterium]